GPVRDLSDGPSATPVTLFGELMLVSTVSEKGVGPLGFGKPTRKMADARGSDPFFGHHLLPKGRTVRRVGQLLLLGMIWAASAGSTGCSLVEKSSEKLADAGKWAGSLDRWHWFTAPPAPPPPADSLVLRGDKLEPETLPKEGTAAADVAGALVLYRRGEYKTAGKIFHKVAEN